jgi:DNA-binding NarL/FixJ family response regulator
MSAPEKRILIIEDDPQTRENLITILEMEGFEPSGAANGRRGVELALRDKPDLILCDVMMPELDGHGVLTALRSDERTSAIPFLFLTARGERQDLRAGMNLGADDYLTKPVTASELLSAIEARLKREALRPPGEFNPDFSSSVPLETLGLTPREAEVLLWVAQGKSNGEISTILGTAENTVKKHLQNLFEKLGIESRNAATVRALELLSSPLAKRER